MKRETSLNHSQYVHDYTLFKHILIPWSKQFNERKKNLNMKCKDSVNGIM